MMPDFGALERRLQTFSSAVDDAALALLHSDPRHAGLYDMLRYHLGLVEGGEQAGGKRLRPALCLLVAEGLGGDWRPALPAAVAVELVHQFSLVHDDIEDGSRLRRHRETVWARWGMAQGVNAGDALLIAAHRALVGEVAPRLSPELALQALTILDDACRDLCEGQYLDIAWERGPPVTVEDYLGMVERKTARLFQCAAELGALSVGASPEVQQHVGQFARALGLAFQAADDILGVWSSESATGKTTAEDIMSRKKALPATLALADAGPQGERLRALFAVDRPLQIDETEEAVAILDHLGVRGRAEVMLEGFRDEAIEHLSEAAASDQVADLRYFTELALPRS